MKSSNFDCNVFSAVPGYYNGRYMPFNRTMLLVHVGKTCGSAVTFFLHANKVTGALRYFAHNTVAAFTILPVLWLDQNWPIFALESSWTVLSLLAVGRCLWFDSSPGDGQTAGPGPL